MRTETRTIYSASELREKLPEAFERAHRRYCERLDNIPWQEETVQSLLELIKRTGYTVRNYSIGAYNRGNGLWLDSKDCDELTGKRAWAWLETNLLEQLRVPVAGKRRWELSKYGERAGSVPSCPLTGYCADEDYLDALRANIRAGCSVKESLADLANTCAKLLEQEDKAQLQEDYFAEHADANGWEFDEEGQII